MKSDTAQHLRLPVINATWTRRQLQNNLSRVMSPTVGYHALQLLSHPKPNLPNIAAILHGDPFLAAKIVAMANLLRTTRQGPTLSLEYAVAALGPRASQRLILGIMLAGPLATTDSKIIRRTDLWRWVFGCAAAGDYLASQINPEKWKRAGGRYLVSGLLLGLGALILHAGLGRPYSKLLGSQLRPVQLTDRERRTLGVDHHEVTVWALNAMNCPRQLSQLAQAMANSHDQNNAAALRGRAVEMLGARAAGFEPERTERWLKQASPSLGLPSSSWVKRSLPPLRQRVRALGDVFKISLPDPPASHAQRQQLLAAAGAAMQSLLHDQLRPHTPPPGK
jgi:HD-like signal output (HDOD) protein